MGFRKPTDADTIIGQLRQHEIETRSAYNDGWTAASCKRELYRVKCWLEDVYPTLPHFTGEEEWEQERMVDILKRKT